MRLAVTIRRPPRDVWPWLVQVADLPACIAALKNAGVTFRTEMEVGPGGRQIQIEDPGGNPIELFEPAR
jgi:glyoxylase I family protein